MASTAPAAEPDTADMLAQVDNDPSLLLLGKVDFDAYFASLREEVWPEDTDISTKAGRDRLKSSAQSVRTRKAAIDRRRKDLTEGWRKKTAEVNAVGKSITERLDVLIEDVRRPVTEWEEREAKRIAEADAILADLESAKTITYGSTSKQVQERLDRIRGINLNDEVLGPRLEMAQDMQREAVEVLTGAVADLKANEEREAELERLRAQEKLNEERRQREEQERIDRERAEEARKAEEERRQRAAKEAAENARREAEQRAEQERLEREREAQAKIDAANERAAAAEREAQAERDRIAKEEADRKAEAEREAEAQRKREADVAHRQQVIDTAAEALTGISGMTQKMAKAVVNEIAAGNVPAVSIRF